MSQADRQRLSAIAHADSPVWGPLSESTVAGLAERLRSAGIGRESRVLDLGCGIAELLRRVCEATGASGIGVDASPFAIEAARRRLAASPARDRIQLRLDDVTALGPDASQDLVICIGPGWDSGGWTSLTGWAARFATTHGHLLLAETAWRAHPPAEALARLGLTADAYILTADVRDAVAAAGVEVDWVHRSNDEEWAAYAGAYRGALRQFARDHPGDPLVPAVRDRAEAGWSQYELLHELLDFVLVLARTA
ncbi:MAG TPA: class I SAM-dependent methyltransferase [Methylomirabilota bacterium]|nr:class I SAM-dependent methyltransferase [Methylomirabilota bacterium]